MKKIIFLIICLLIQFSYGQIGIHKEDQHSINAVLHMEAPTNIAKGIMLPKYTTTQRDQLSMVNGVLKLTADDDGLLIYNTTEKCFNMWHSDVAEWKSLCADSDATITVDCANITVEGEYKQVVELDRITNYITIPITVTKAGLYNFVVKRQTDNGYNFISKLTYLTPSDTQVVLEATGTPISQSTGDIFTVIIHDNIVCSFTVPVIENPARYTLDCDNIIVRGSYRIRRELTDDHYLIVPVNVSQVGYYTLSTPIVNGFSFKAEGFFYQPGEQYVFLKATGTPLDNINATFTISGTPTGAATNTCNVTITSVLEGKKILTFGGYSNYFGYGMNKPPVAYNSQAMGPRLLQSVNMFGDQPSSMFKVEPLIYGIHLINGAATDTDPLTYVDDNILKKYTTGPDPVDIIFFGERSELHPEGAQLVVDFIKKGGVVLYFHEYMDSNDNSLTVFKGILNSVNLINNDFNRRNSPGELYTFSNQAGYSVIPLDDPIVHGPFGDVLGKSWGEDASNTLTLKHTANYDKSQIIAYTNSNGTGSNDGITGFRHKNYNFLWFGDGGFMSSCTDTNRTICPYNSNSNNMPIPKIYGSTTTYAQNSIVIANALAWAIKQAEFTGINAQN